MARWTSKEARKSRFLPLMREWVRSYQAFERFDARLHIERGLTPPQADVLFSLGNTDGLTCKELGERTLITKGTLTGVLDRMESKGLILRRPSPKDRRSKRILLSASGERMFERIFPEHLSILKERFDQLSRSELRETTRALRQLRQLFESP